MNIPSPVYDPPFNITRASHVVLVQEPVITLEKFLAARG